MASRHNNQSSRKPEQKCSADHGSHPEPAESPVLPSLLLDPDREHSLQLVHLTADGLYRGVWRKGIARSRATHAVPLTRKYDRQALCISSGVSSGFISRYLAISCTCEIRSRGWQPRGGTPSLS